MMIKGTAQDVAEQHLPPLFAPASQHRVIDLDGRSIHVRIWPGDAARTVLIWHGVAGTSSDHVSLAERLNLLGYQVVAPDSPGCGGSDWAAGRVEGYGLAALSNDATALLDALAIGRVCWIGLSKGGGLGIRVAAETPKRVAALLLYDVGPSLPAQFRAALAQRLGAPPRFATVQLFRHHIERMLDRSGLRPDPVLVDRLTISWTRRLDDGTVGYHYDPALSEQFTDCPDDFDLWSFWDRIACPVLIMRGEHSTVLPDHDLHAMLARQGTAKSVTVAGAGHVNFLDDRAQQDAVIAFFATVA